MQEEIKTPKEFNKHCDLTFVGDVCPKCATELCSKANSQLPKGEKSQDDVQGKREDASNNQNGDGGIMKVVDSSSHLPPLPPADDTQIADKESLQ